MTQKYKAMGSSITMRFIIAYVLTAVLLILSFTLLVFENQIDLIGENALLRTMTAGRQISDVVNSSEDYEALVEDLEGKTHLNIRYVKIFSERGQLLAASDSVADIQVSPQTIRSIQKAITKRDFENTGYHHELLLDERLIDLYIPGSSDTIVLVAGISIDEIDGRIDTLFRQSGIMTVMVAVVHLIFAFFTYYALISPLRKILNLLGRISEGNYKIDFPKHRKDEFGLITKKIEQMSLAILDVHDEAKNANPLTGLPGNIALEREIQKRIAGGNAFSVLYCDLDQFKAYNDVYGFSRGDDIILYTKDIIQRSIDRSHARNCFFGHEGGDDFVVVCDFYDWEKIAAFCVDDFDKGVEGFYTPEDRAKGEIQSVDRKGKKRSFPFVSISIAVVTNHFRKIESFGQVAQYAAEMKKVVKEKKGSAYLIDRRTR